MNRGKSSIILQANFNHARRAQDIILAHIGGAWLWAGSSGGAVCGPPGHPAWFAGGPRRAWPSYGEATMSRPPARWGPAAVVSQR